MRAVYWKELRELALVGIPLAIAAAFTGWEYAWPADQIDELLALVILGGLMMGVAHGLIDRQRRNDLFLRHRPLSGERLAASRAAAGATVVLVAAALLLAFLAWGAAHQARFLDQFRGTISPLDLEVREITPGLVAYVLLLPTAVWAGIRWIFSAPRRWLIPLLLFAAPFLLAAPVGRTDSLGVALVLMAVIAAACTYQIVARRRAVVMLFLCGWLLLEGAVTLRALTQEMLADVYPTYGVTGDGEVRSWKHWGRRTCLFDLERNELSHGRDLPLVGYFGFGLSADADYFEWVDRTPPYFVEDGPAPRVWAWKATQWLDWMQAGPESGVRLAWDYEAGRFVCRDRTTGDVVAGFGPDGYVSGPEAASGATFEGVSAFRAFRPGSGSEQNLGHLTLPGGKFVLVAGREPGDNPEEPLRIEVSWRPGSVLDVVTRRRVTYSLQRHADRVVFLRENEELASLPWDEARERIHRAGIFWTNPEEWQLGAAVVTRLDPPHPVVGTYRLRFLAAELPPRSVDVPVQPETALEHTIAGFGGLVALARPLPLVLASYFAPAPRDFEAMASWWWLDPWFGGRRMTGWLVAALVLAALLAWWARRQALRRCETMRAVHFWTGVAVVLGPLGVIWMRLTVPWAVVEPVGDGVRAVNRDATPQNDAPWPAPAPVGTEVFVR